MNTHIHVIPHSKQRYETVGDWCYDANGTLHIYVSEMSDGRFEQCVALHEEIEARLCDQAGIDEADVTAWDVAFEKRRVAGNTDEPGDDPHCPYYKQHQFASGIERTFAAELGINWQEYEKELNGLKK